MRKKIRESKVLFANDHRSIDQNLSEVSCGNDPSTPIGVV